jgi:hypothetical protein
MSGELPGFVQVGPVRYTVDCSQDCLDRVMLREKADLRGHIDCKTQRIFIAPGQGPDETACTLMHEVLHAIVRVALGDINKVDEDQIEQLCFAVTDTLRRNPELVAYLMEGDYGAE